MAMHEGYIPTSPLSPASARHGSSGAQQNMRKAHVRQTSRTMQMSLPKFHPMSYPHHGSVASPSAGTPSPSITVNGQARQVPSPVVVGRNYLSAISTSSSQSSVQNGKPTSPRLEPLNSPRGAVTPLALEGEEGGDYFTVKGAGKPSPAGSPGAASSRSEASSGGDHPITGKSKRKVDVYQ